MIRNHWLWVASCLFSWGCSNGSATESPDANASAVEDSAASSQDSAAPHADAGGGGVDATVDAAATTADATVSTATPEDAGASTDAAAAPSDASASTNGDGDVDAALVVVTLPTPNAGCSKNNPPTGSLNLNIDGGAANYIVTLPTGYRAGTAVPLVFAFHGRNRTNEQFEDVDALDIKTEIAPFAIIVYPQSQGGPGWEMAPELPVNIVFFESLWSTMFDDYCVDTTRVFVMGHSSGAMFSNILACRYGEQLRGVGAVAGEQLETTCAGNVAAMIIHGGQDPIVPTALGEASRDFYLARNQCQMTTTPGEVAPCVAYDGCLPPFPVEWCEHTEPTYTMTDGGGHGYPTFASKAIWHFFSALKAKP